VRETLDYCRTELARMREQLGGDADEAIEDCEANLRTMREFIKGER